MDPASKSLLPDPANGEIFTSKQLAFCTSLPKVELHAHLNGSCRASTIRELASTRCIDSGLVQIIERGDRTLAECFKLFDIIHQITTDHETITRITREVIEDFAAESVVYLELRTTPKARPDFGMTKKSYVEAVLNGLKEYEKAVASVPGATPIVVRFLLSIDRREGPEQALATVELAAQLQSEGVLGIDLSGNPAVGHWSSWSSALCRARQLGLKITLHAAEVYNPEETAAMLAMKPERLGHMCYLDDTLEATLRHARIPVELCLSSNVITGSVKGYPDHHFLPLFRSGHPLILCTDDSGVFSTTLSREYAIAAQAFGLDDNTLLKLAEDGLQHCFCEEGVKLQLSNRFKQYRKSLLQV